MNHQAKGQGEASMIRMTQGKQVAILGIALASGLSLATGRPAAAEPVELVQEQLRQAVCLNQWDLSLDLVGILIATPALTPEYRNNLVQFRQRLYSLQDQQQVVRVVGCSDVTAASLEALLNPEATSGLNWREAIDGVR
jgi:hypothetical protein